MMSEPRPNGGCSSELSAVLGGSITFWAQALVQRPAHTWTSALRSRRPPGCSASASPAPSTASVGDTHAAHPPRGSRAAPFPPPPRRACCSGAGRAREPVARPEAETGGGEPRGKSPLLTRLPTRLVVSPFASGRSSARASAPSLRRAAPSCGKRLQAGRGSGASPSRVSRRRPEWCAGPPRSLVGGATPPRVTRPPTPFPRSSSAVASEPSYTLVGPSSASSSSAPTEPGCSRCPPACRSSPRKASSCRPADGWSSRAWCGRSSCWPTRADEPVRRLAGHGAARPDGRARRPRHARRPHRLRGRVVGTGRGSVLGPAPADTRRLAPLAPCLEALPQLRGQAPGARAVALARALDRPMRTATRPTWSRSTRRATPA